MAQVSNTLSGILNLVIFLLSIPILAGGIWLNQRASTDCERFLDKPLIALGVFIMLVSLAGILGSCCRVNCLLWVYLFVMFLLILLVFIFTLFAFAVTNKGAGQAISGRGYKEYHLGDYSNWLQKRVNDDANWRKIKSCLQDSKICKSLEESQDSLDQFIQTHLSPTQSGCCKPPYDCGFIYKNATVWDAPKTGAASDNQDCNTWSNDQDKLCYNCGACKAGVLANIKSDWKKVAVVNIVFLVFLVIAYSIGCCAFRNNRRNGYEYKGHV